MGSIHAGDHGPAWPVLPSAWAPSSHREGHCPPPLPKAASPEASSLGQRGEAHGGRGLKRPTPHTYIPGEIESCPNCPLEEGEVLATRSGWEL